MEVEALSNRVTHILHAWIASRGDSHWVRLHMPPSSQNRWACQIKWVVQWETQTGMCVCSTSTFQKLDMLPWKSVVLRAWETGTRPKTSHHWLPGGERRSKRERLTIFFERVRKGHCHSDEHWNCSNWERKKLGLNLFFIFLLIVIVTITSQDKTELKLMGLVRTEHM